MNFSIATASNIQFGSGILEKSAILIASLGKRVLVVTGKNPARAQPLISALAEHGIAPTLFPVSGEPTTDSVQQGLILAREEERDLVIGFGGGSAIDAAKAIAGLLTNPGGLLDYLEVVGQGQPLINPGVPFVAIPTTAGAGAEVTKNAVLASPKHRVKASLRSPFLLARLAIIDPELALSLPPEITASTGLDALTQLIEPFVSCRANPLTDALCREGIQRAAGSLKRVYEQGDYLAAREEMALASLFSGMALANAGLGAVHGFAAPIGGMFPSPHGAVCAALLPPAMQVNIGALRQRQPNHPALERYAEVARLLTGKSRATPEDGIEWVSRLCQDLRIPPLGQYGIGSSDVSVLCQKASAASSMKGNPIALTSDELETLLRQAI